MDLSDPFIDSASACGLFEIITRLFVRADVGTGKVLVVDEAHKVSLMNIIYPDLTNMLVVPFVDQEFFRTHQCPFGFDATTETSVYASDHQYPRYTARLSLSLPKLTCGYVEPTVVPPVLLDLCTVTILHRFSSPSWWEHLIKHVSADFTGSDAFDKVVRLQVKFWALATLVSTLLTNDNSADWTSHRTCTLGHWHL